jgi:uncharacterized protein (DUF4415 family)
MKSAKSLTAFRVDADMMDAMRRLQERDGIGLSEQMRRALRPWLESKGVLKPVRKAGTKR